MFFILCGMLIGIMLFILVENKKENFGFAFMQILFFSLIGFFISVFLSYTGFAPTREILIDTVYLEELSPNIYLDLEENTFYSEILKKDITSYIINYKDNSGPHTEKQSESIKININIREGDTPYVKIYEKQFKKDYYKYFFFKDSQKNYEFNVNLETYKSLNIKK